MAHKHYYRCRSSEHVVYDQPVYKKKKTINYRDKSMYSNTYLYPVPRLYPVYYYVVGMNGMKIRSGHI